jgi:NAD(P)-dependent dehydrogenase (short-subunit alcohol dehydrogenase family)
MGDVAVVTGASAGFGLDTARKLVQAGYRVFGTVRDPGGRNVAAAKELASAGITVVDLDVTSQDSVDRGAAAILEDAGRVDVLINNAGVAHFGITEAMTPEAVEQQFATNFVGVHRMDRAFLPGMRERRHGLIVFVSSVVGRYVAPFNGIYAASKWAVEALAEGMSYELRSFGIDVTIVEPGPYATNIFAATRLSDDTATVAAYGELGKRSEQVPENLKKVARDPGEVGDAIVAVVEMPAGQRPLRVGVPAGSAVQHYNEVVLPLQREWMESRGLGGFLAPAPSPEPQVSAR